jgi:hypothetical protein
MISTSSSGVNIPTTKSNTKDKLSSQKWWLYTST